MFERYTERARRVLFFARYEASQLGTAAIGSEHLLLGLLRDGGAPGVSAQAFARAGLDYMAVRKELAELGRANRRLEMKVEILKWAYFACGAAASGSSD